MGAASDRKRHSYRRASRTCGRHADSPDQHEQGLDGARDACAEWSADPMNPYGASKVVGENYVAEQTPEHLIVRTAWLFGPSGESLVTKIRRAAIAAREARIPLDVVEDEWGNPTWSPDLASSIVRAVAADWRGILHLAGEPPSSRYEWAAAALRGWGVELRPVTRDVYVRASTVPRRAILDTTAAAGLGIPVMDWRPRVADLTSVEEIGA